MDFDVVIGGGTVYDGTGRPGTRADVGVRGDRVEAIGDLRAAAAGLRMDAGGLVVAPGQLRPRGRRARPPARASRCRRGR